MNVPFKKANILLPKNTEMEKWAVVACDQYTSEPEYWKEVENIVGDAPSTLKIILPEIYLEQDNVQERIANINKEMDHLLSTDFFKTLDNSLILECSVLTLLIKEPTCSEVNKLRDII